MYPARELKQLAARRAALQEDIALRRSQCADAAARVAGPLAWADRVAALWHGFPSLARSLAAPLGLGLARAGMKRLRQKLAMRPNHAHDPGR